MVRSITRKRMTPKCSNLVYRKWSWGTLEVILFWGSKVKSQGHQADGARRPVSETSAVTYNVKDEGRRVTWRVWQVLADKSRTKRPRNTKIGGKVIHSTGNNAYKFQGQRSKVKVTWSITLHNNTSFRTTITFARWQYQYYNITTALHCYSLLAMWR